MSRQGDASVPWMDCLCCSDGVVVGEVVTASESAKLAPNLVEYFVLLESSAVEVVELVNVALDEKKLAALRARRAKGRARIAQLVRQSFQRHDLDHNGYLDHHESAEFFLHYVDLWMDFNKRVGVKMILANMLVTGRADAALQRMPRPPGLKRELSSSIEQAEEKLRSDVEQRYEEYCADKGARNAAAFQVVDTDGDGKLSQDELVAALTPRTPEWYALHGALFGTHSEDEQFQTAAEAMGRPECVQS